MQSISVFLDITKVADSGEKLLMLAELKVWVFQVIYMFFGPSLGKV